MSQHTEDHLPHYRVRPRFKVESELSVKELIDKIRLALEDENAPCTARVHDGYATLYIPSEEQHYWSPQLTLSVDTKEEGGSLLRGLYGPRPSVWTMFVFFYALIGFAIMVVAIIGFSAWSLGNPIGILYFIPILIAIFLSLYFTAYFGQKIGHDQMLVLHTFVEKALDMRIMD